jgi:signal peptidase I
MQAGTEKPVSWTQIVLVGRNPRRTLIRMVILCSVAFVFFRFVCLPIRVLGISMLPTYKSNRVNFVNRLAYLFHEPRRGDVVSVRTSGMSVMYMKRVVALPGETIAFTNGIVYINGERLNEPYLKLAAPWNIPPEVVRPGHFFVVGDNRSMEHTNHEKGQAEKVRIVGKVLL